MQVGKKLYVHNIGRVCLPLGVAANAWQWRRRNGSACVNSSIAACGSGFAQAPPLSCPMALLSCFFGMATAGCSPCHPRENPYVRTIATRHRRRWSSNEAFYFAPVQNPDLPFSRQVSTDWSGQCAAHLDGAGRCGCRPQPSSGAGISMRSVRLLKRSALIKWNALLRRRMQSTNAKA